ncbi:MAG: DUF5777 family beta-barrel protein [Bacteroidetes bacterium]|nr:DUF5777 family beta-barrel protein [Bacteroidota bacterium]
MKINFKKLNVTLAFVALSIGVFAQDDMLGLLDSVGGKKTHEKVMATFKGSKIINAQSTETVKAKTYDFSITHRFGNMGTASNGGGHTLYGLDGVTDVRFGFDFGITNDLTIGIGRSKQRELVDGFVKYRLLTQTLDNHIPLSLAIYADMGYTPQLASQFYSGMVVDSTFKQSEMHRFSYTTQLLIARKFGWRFSMQLTPTYQHRNFILADINADNGKVETNDLMSMGIGFRFKFTKRFAFIADYFYTFSDYRTNNTANPFYNPLALGFEVETGGHVFHLNFTNASGIVENNFLPYTTDNWLKGGYKFGFNVSRVFNIGGRKKHK